MSATNGGRPCTICRHSDRVAIDKALIAQEGFEAVSRRFAVNPDALARHFKNHVPTEAMQAGAEAAIAAEASHGAGLVRGASELRDKAMALLAKAEEDGDLRTALAGVREAARCLELVAKMTGLIDQTVQVNIALSAEFTMIRTTILAALAPHPEARAAVVSALAGLS